MRKPCCHGQMPLNQPPARIKGPRYAQHRNPARFFGTAGFLILRVPRSRDLCEVPCKLLLRAVGSLWDPPLGYVLLVGPLRLHGGPYVGPFCVGVL